MNPLRAALGTFVLLSATSFSTSAGEVTGTITDVKNNTPATKVLVCLQREGQADDCLKSTFTNKKGEYKFKGIEGNYVVRVSAGTLLATRKQNPYPTYAWNPPRQQISVAKRGTSEVDFSGGFNFSNFQSGLTLIAGDFPELVSEAILKVYASDDNGAEMLLFLGQVDPTNEGFSIVINVPLSTTVIYYDIFGSITKGEIDISSVAAS
jgi:hypothetical protein